MDSSLQPLLDKLSTHEFEEYGWLALRAATWTANDLTLDLIVRQQDRADEPWRLHCRDVRRSRIVNHGAERLSIETQHPVLLPHTENVAELYFSNRPPDPDTTVAQLVEAHRTFVGEWFDCFYFFNLLPGRPLRGLLDGGFGKLAEGPQPLIERYAEVLRRAGVAVSSPPSRAPTWWDGGRWVDEVKPCFAVIFGDSYVVSAYVTAEKA